VLFIGKLANSPIGMHLACPPPWHSFASTEYLLGQCSSALPPLCVAAGPRELLISLPEDASASSDPDSLRHAAGGSSSPLPLALAGNAPPAPSPSPSTSAWGSLGGVPEAESDRVVLGRLYLDGKEPPQGRLCAEE